MLQSSHPLDGITVLDFGQVYNDPYASFLLAMGGARVTEIEPPSGREWLDALHGIS
jgi:crotonobetainyl-CoA:carnitine CoA-transferase CaiB-like acyl-CoA transferase